MSWCAYVLTCVHDVCVCVYVKWGNETNTYKKVPRFQHLLGPVVHPHHTFAVHPNQDGLQLGAVKLHLYHSRLYEWVVGRGGLKLGGPLCCSTDGYPNPGGGGGGEGGADHHA